MTINLLLIAIVFLTPFPRRSFSQDSPTNSSGSAPQYVTDQTVQATAEGLRWLARRQRMDGSFGNNRERSESVGIAALCGIAFLCSGSVPEAGDYSETINRTVEFLLSCSQKNGYLVDSDSASHGPMYGHGFATMFLAEVYGMTPRDDLGEKLRRAVDLIIATQNSEGGWRYNPVPQEADVSVTVCQVMALRSARNAGISVPKEVVDRAVNYIKSCQNPGGGFRYRPFDPAESRLARSAAAVVALYSAGVSDDPVVQNGLNYVVERLKIRDDREYYFYAQYYAAQAAWQARDNRWRICFPILRDELLSQRAGDHWEDPLQGDEYATAMALVALQIPYDVLPIFER
ncbi:prenyltransferase/squalene oxidase repeat-containing protein [Thalassoglobus neptunius]|uniref:prenyltransferase/squalene oxidase repeat-containing protein n=1 Tax=Thalassoglobus neptunius TaxID=1938619 RepID=UPI001E30021D|nr:prenyltransferase/squalene oxidase repeat-containing protein [Thalassoglobus neptunius]